MVGVEHTLYSNRVNLKNWEALAPPLPPFPCLHPWKFAKLMPDIWFKQNQIVN